MASQDDGNNPWQMVHGNVFGIPMGGVWSLLYRGTDSVLAFTDDQWGTPSQRRQLWFPKGAYFGYPMDDTQHLEGLAKDPADAPTTIGTGAVGTSNRAARADHVHPHGSLAGGALHALAIAGNPGAAGFISGVSQAKLNAIVMPIGIERLTGDLHLYVASGGNDTNAARTETQGNVTGKPFLTIAGALAYLPHDRSLDGFDVTITDQRSATSESVNVRGFRNGRIIIDDAQLGDSVIAGCEDVVFSAIDLVGALESRDSTVDIDASLDSNGAVAIYGGRAHVELTADSCTNTALYAEGVAFLSYGIVANGCTAIPVDIVACAYSEIAGSGIAGSNPSAPRSVRISAGGRHVLTGATMTCGSGQQLDVDGYTVSWGDLSWENVESGGTFAFWADNRWVRTGRVRIVNNSSTPYDDLIVASLQYGTYIKPYGYWRPLDPAYKEVTAHAGGGQGSAVLGALQYTLVTAAASDHDFVRLPGASDGAAFGGGAKLEVWNRTAKIVDVYPASGKKVFLGGADLGANNPFELAPGQRVYALVDNDENYNVG